MKNGIFDFIFVATPNYGINKHLVLSKIVNVFIYKIIQTNDIKNKNYILTLTFLNIT